MTAGARAAFAAAALAAVLGAVGCGDGDGTTPAGGGPRVGFLVEDGVYNSELFAPLDVFDHVRFHGAPDLEVCLIAPTRDPVTTFEGQRVVPDFSYADAPPLDVLVVPSAERHVREDFDDPMLVDFVRQHASGARFVVSLCDGAFVLAAAGLLDGRSCTTFPGDVAALAERRPAARVIDGVVFAVDGKLVTGAGGARSYDPALYVVERMFGEQTARRVAGGLVLDWHLPAVPHWVEGGGDSRAFRPGERVDASAAVEDGEGGTVRLLDLFAEEERVLALVLVGGASARDGEGRGGLWCEDSFHELSAFVHLRARFAGRGVGFVAVACPPVFHEERFGFAAGDFTPGAVRPAARADFVTRTRRALEAAAGEGLRLYFDPSFRLLGDPAGEGDGPPWRGRFRAPHEHQRYGTPTWWLLGRDGRVLVPPLSGNNHEKDAPLRYTEREAAAVIERALASSGS